MSTQKTMVVVHLPEQGKDLHLKDLGKIGKILVEQGYPFVALDISSCQPFTEEDIYSFQELAGILQQSEGRGAIFGASRENDKFLRVMNLDRNFVLVSSREGACKALGCSHWGEVSITSLDQLDSALSAMEIQKWEEPKKKDTPKGSFYLEKQRKNLGQGQMYYYLDISGDLNMVSVSQLENTLEEVLLEETPLMVLSLANLNYINSSGMGALVKASDRAMNKGGLLILVDLPEKIEGMFRMLGLLNTLQVKKNLSEAEEEFQGVLAKKATHKPKVSKKQIREVPGLNINVLEELDLPNGQKGLMVEAVGAIDTLTCRYFEEVMKSYLDEGYKFLAVNFSKIDYINSTGLGTLVKLHDMLSEQGGALGLLDLSVKIYDLMEMLGIVNVVDVHKDIDEWKKAFTQKAKEAPAEAVSAKAEPIPPSSLETKEEPSQRKAPIMKEKPSSAPKEPAPAPKAGEFFVESGSRNLGNLQMEWSTLRASGKSIMKIKLAGSIDTVSVMPMERQVMEFFNEGASLFLLDFEGVDYINSTGIGLLVKISDMAREKGGEFATVNTSIKVKNLLEMLGVDFALNICDTEDEAFAKLLGEKLVTPEAEVALEEPAESGMEEFAETRVSAVVSEEEAAEVSRTEETAPAAEIALEEPKPAEEVLEPSLESKEEGKEEETLINTTEEKEVPSSEEATPHEVEAISEVIGETKADSDVTDEEAQISSSVPVGMEEEETSKVGDSELSIESKMIQLIQESERLEKEGKYKEAITLLEKAMEEEKYPDALNKRIEKLQEKMKEKEKEPSLSAPVASQEDFIEAAIAGASTQEITHEDIDAVLNDLATSQTPKEEEPAAVSAEEGREELSTKDLQEDLDQLAQEINKDSEASSLEGVPTEDISLDALSKNLASGTSEVTSSDDTSGIDLDELTSETTPEKEEVASALQGDLDEL
ncbi:MAG: STAS domain-containing protein, partial [Planctomycetota bacterium]